MIVIRSPRLQLSQFQISDAREVFGCITRAVAKFMPWEPPSWSEYITRCEKRVQDPEPNKFSFVVRRLDNDECLGMASLEDAYSVWPELGLWLKESAHRQVAVQNIASRRIAESLDGEIIGAGTNSKYGSVIYRIPSTSRHSS